MVPSGRTRIRNGGTGRNRSTIWLHGGVYPGDFTATLTGADGAPITVRSYPGDWATIDGGTSDATTFSLQGEWAIYRDFEVTNSRADRWGGRPEGMYVLGPHLKVVNLLIHDLGNCGYWSSGVDVAGYPDNTYLAARPAENRIFVRPNRYEPGRAHVVVYNWTLAETADVDLGGVLTVDADFEVRNAQNWFAGPIVSGTFDGNPVRLPMTGLSPAQPYGSPTAIDAGETTGTEFNVFVVRRNPAACLPAG